MSTPPTYEIRKRIKMNHVRAFTPIINQQSEIRAPKSKGCVAAPAAEAEHATAPLPLATASDWLSLISVWLNTLPPTDAAGLCQLVPPQSA